MSSSEYELVPISGGRAWAKVDPADFPLVSEHRWCLGRSGNRRTTYAQRRVKGTTQTMHSFLTGLPKVDHINHDGLDNRRVNLRDGSGCVNERNSRKTVTLKTSPYKGVCWRQPDKSHGSGWEANIRVEGRQVYLGKFDVEVDAARAYDEAALRHFGESASVNFALAGATR